MKAEDNYFLHLVKIVSIFLCNSVEVNIATYIHTYIANLYLIIIV